jgi:K+-transporting ATPase c subunit
MSNVTPQNNQPSGDSALPVLALIMAFVFPLAGAIIGHVALNQMRNGQIVDTNRSLAKSGMILGWVFTALGFIFIVLYVVLIVLAFNSGFDLTDYDDY